MPPLAGFAAKFLVFAPLAVDPQRYPLLLTLLVIGGLNTVISLFYYLRVVKVMALDPEPEDRLPVCVPADLGRRCVRRVGDDSGAGVRCVVGPVESLVQEAAKSLLS